MPIAPDTPILVVDDYKTTIRIIHGMLRQLGYVNLDEASDGQQALGKIQSSKYGLVISDWNMEPMTGLELLQRLRQDPRHQRLPFIMITAEGNTENVIKAKQAGASNYMLKPFNQVVLGQKIEAVLKAA
jgi:two-component system chemotaxis response regulator CheY